MGYNQGGYTGKYSGKAGKNPGRNPQPGWGGGGSGGGGSKSGCPLFMLQVAFLLSVPAVGLFVVAKEFFG